MKLRSGFVYTCNVKYEKRKWNLTKARILYLKKRKSEMVETKDDVNTTCAICMVEYKKGDTITSCSKENITKHSFHSKCMKLHIVSASKMTGNSIGPFHCPYCMVKLNKFEIYTAKKE